MSGAMYNTEQLPQKSPLRLVTSTETTFFLWSWHQGGKETASLASSFLKILPLLALLKGFSNRAKKIADGRKKGRVKEEFYSL